MSETVQLDVRGVCTLLQVFDMPRSVRFYCELLEFKIIHRSPTYATENHVELFHWALLRRPEGTEIMLNTVYDQGERPAMPDKAREAAHDDTRLYFACANVDAAYGLVRTLGIRCSPPANARYGMRQLSFQDPDGYGITLQWPIKTDESSTAPNEPL